MPMRDKYALRLPPLTPTIDSCKWLSRAFDPEPTLARWRKMEYVYMISILYPLGIVELVP